MHSLLILALGAALTTLSILLLVPVAFFFLQVLAARNGLMPMCASQHLPPTIRFPYRFKDSAVFEWLSRTLPADQADGSVVNVTRAANLKACVHSRTCGERV
jgi:hypothetical protein